MEATRPSPIWRRSSGCWRWRTRREWSDSPSKPIALSDLSGKGRDKVTLDRVPIPEATRYAAEKADVAFRLACLLKPRLVAERRMTIYETLERPLVSVLADMERTGIMIAPPFLA